MNPLSLCQNTRFFVLNYLEKTQEKITDLALSCIRASFDFLAALEGCLIESQNQKGETFLHRSIRRGCNSRSIYEMIQKSRNLEVVKNEGLTALDYACYPISKHKNTIQVLLDQGARKVQADSLNFGLESLYQEDAEDCEKIVRSLIQLAIDQRLSIDLTGILMYIAKYGLEVFFNFLVEQFPEINFSKKHSNGLTPLMVAIQFGQIQIAKRFIQEMKQRKQRIQLKQSPPEWFLRGTINYLEMAKQKGYEEIEKDLAGHFFDRSLYL